MSGFSEILIPCAVVHPRTQAAQKLPSNHGPDGCKRLGVIEDGGVWGWKYGCGIAGRRGVAEEGPTELTLV